MSVVGHAAAVVAIALLGASLVFAAVLVTGAGPEARRRAQSATQLRLAVLGTGFAIVGLIGAASVLLVVVLVLGIAGLAFGPDPEADPFEPVRVEPAVPVVPGPATPVAPPAPTRGPLWSRR